MSLAKITMLGLERYLTLKNDSIFAELTLPVGVDKDVVENSILDSGSEFEVLYPNPDTFKMMVGIWSKKYAKTIEKWYETCDIEYVINENLKRTDSTTDTDSRTQNTSTTNNNTSSDSATEHINSEEKTSAFDSSSYQPKNNNTSDNTSGSSGSINSNGTVNATDSGTATHTTTSHGSIGVITNQVMLEQEMTFRNKWKLYDLITEQFLKDFCIMVY